MKVNVITANIPGNGASMSSAHRGTLHFPCEPRIGDELWFYDKDIDADLMFVITKREFAPSRRWYWWNRMTVFAELRERLDHP